MTLWELGHDEQADYAFARAEKLKPDEPFIRYNRLELALVRGDFKTARAEVAALQQLPLPAWLRDALNNIVQKFPQLQNEYH